MVKNTAPTLEIGTDEEFVLPARFFVVALLLTLFMIILSTSGWTMSLFYLTYVIIFFIFFNIIPYSENFQQSIANQHIHRKKPRIQINCEEFKKKALDNMNNYMKCMDTAKPKVVCPKEFQNTKDIKNYANKSRDLIQNDNYLKEKEPSNTTRVCGLIPGHAFKGTSKKENNIMTDKELAKAINLDLKLHKALNDIENQLIEDPLNVNAQKLLHKVQNQIAAIKPKIIQNLRHKNKGGDFIKKIIDIDNL